MTLGAYLRGAPAAARPNPGGPLILRHRHAEGGAWREVCRHDSPEAMRDEWLSGTAHWREQPSPGDLARVDQGDMALLPIMAFGVARGGGLRPLPQLAGDPQEPDGWRGNASCARWVDEQHGLGRWGWQELWPRCPDPRWLLRAAAPLVPRASLVRAAAACVRAGLAVDAHLFPPDPDVVRLLTLAEAGAPDPAAYAALQRASDDVSRAARCAVAGGRNRLRTAATLVAAMALKIMPSTADLVSFAILAVDQARQGLPPSEPTPRGGHLLDVMVDAVRRALPFAEVVLGLTDGDGP